MMTLGIFSLFVVFCFLLFSFIALLLKSTRIKKYKFPKSKASSKIWYTVLCKATGEAMLEVTDETITAKEACTVYINGDEIKALKKGETMPLLKVKK